MGQNQAVAFRTPFFEIDEIESPTRDRNPYYRLRGPDSAIVLVFNELGEILLVRQFRPALSLETLEFPAGAIEENESPHEAAKREVLEETGCETELFKLGDYFHLMMNRTNIKDFLYCGLLAKQTSLPPETGIQSQWVSRGFVRHAAFNGDYRQLAGLGILLLASESLGINVLTCSAEELVGRLRTKIRECTSTEIG